MDFDKIVQGVYSKLLISLNKAVQVSPKCFRYLITFIALRLYLFSYRSFQFITWPRLCLYEKNTLKIMCFVMVPERLVDFQLLWHLFEILNKLNIGCFCRLFRLVLICLTHSQRSLNNVRGRDWKVGFIGAVLYNWRCPNLLNGTFSNGLSKTKNLLKAQFLPNAKISACGCYVNQASSKFFYYSYCLPSLAKCDG